MLSKGVEGNAVFFDNLRIFERKKRPLPQAYRLSKRSYYTIYSDTELLRALHMQMIQRIYYRLFFKKSGILICISLFAAGRKEGAVLSVDGAACFGASWVFAAPVLKLPAPVNLGTV